MLGKGWRMKARAVLYGVQDGLCLICERPMTPPALFQWPPGDDDPSVEHVWPGQACELNGYGVVAASHRRCNNDKGDRLPTWQEVERLAAINGRLRSMGFEVVVPFPLPPIYGQEAA